MRSARDRPGREPWIRVLVHAKSRPRALTRLRNLGFRAVYLKGNAEPPTPEEIDAVLHHPERLVWRAAPVDEAEPWHPIAHLLAAYRAPHPAPAPKPPQLPDAPVLRRGG
ncbi:hypothetical protein [Streptomyces sp. NPDC005438]|uniref:hypothetical protein n=1 Tax=Streptomyces sp. NPDC005438 TaxID=3156880 RepID=UPI0033AAA63F